MKLKFRVLILFISAVFVFLGACVPDEFKKEYNTDILWEPSFTGPVAYGALSIEDILNNADSTGLIYKDSDNLMYVAFREKLEEIIAGDWIEIPDQQFVQIYYDYPVSVPDSLLGPVGDTMPHEANRLFPFELSNNARIDSVLIKSGNLRTRTRSTLHHEGILISKSDFIKKDGQPYYQETVISDASGNFTNEFLTPIDGYWIYMDNESSQDTSFLKIDFEYYLINSGQDITAGEYVSVTKNFEDVMYEAVYGSVGNFDTTLIEDEVFDFELFEGDFSGVIYFGDPRFKLFVESSMGVPIGINLFNVSAYYAATDTRKDLVFTPGTNPFVINFPKINEIGQTKSTTIQVDKDNSNIHELTNSNISQFRFSAGALTYPPGSDMTENFVLDTSKLSVDFEIELPMNLRIEDFEMEQTVGFNLGIDDSEIGDIEISTLEIKLATINWMPVDINMQVFLVDSAHNVLDSLFNEDNKHILQSGSTTDGIVTDPHIDTVTVTVISDNYDKVMDTDSLIINATIETTNSGQTPVKLLSTSSIEFSVSVRLDAKLETTEE